MQYDAIIIGAGGAGLFCAGIAGQRGRRVLLLDHAASPGEKIRISGGGRCNFTNLHAGPKDFLSQNPHFAKSALKRFTQQDFIALVDRYGIAWHEKTLGQLFCDGSSKQIIQMLLDECEQGGVTLKLASPVASVMKTESGFRIQTASADVYEAAQLVIATGGPSIPKMGASGWGYEIAKQFGLGIVAPKPALVPFTFDGREAAKWEEMAGVAVEDALAACGKTTFREALLFTHKGLSGPAVLQISSYWEQQNRQQPVRFNLLPGQDAFALLKTARTEKPKSDLATVLSALVPKRLAQRIAEIAIAEGRMADQSDARLRAVAAVLQDWQLTPGGTEGYAKAEVTLGGVDTDGLSSQTMGAKAVPGLYFIGEVVDVTGHLGGFNFQWAWSSGHACGMAL